MLIPASSFLMLRLAPILCSFSHGGHHILTTLNHELKSSLILQRPGTADSVLSEPVSPRLHTSNTLVLPR